MNMSERFKYYFPSQVIKDNKTGQRYYGNKPLTEILNKLSEENEQLKKQLNAFKPIIFEDANNGGSSILYEKVEE